MSADPLRPISWMAWLFAVGSACFAIGVPVSQVSGLQPTVSAAVFFMGSVFFTAAATIQLRLVKGANLRDPAWSSAAVQWLGTLYFNATTLWSLVDATGTETVSNQVIWRPDAVGSVLFLISSAIACLPVVREHRHSHVRDRSWTIAAANMLGSIFFGISAVGAYVAPDSNELLNSVWSNGGTLLGALCFLAGSLLLLPPRRAHRTTTVQAT